MYPNTLLLAVLFLFWKRVPTLKRQPVLDHFPTFICELSKILTHPRTQLPMHNAQRTISDMTNARDCEEIPNKMQVHGERRSVGCRNLQNHCKTNAIQRAAQAGHTEASQSRSHLIENRAKTVENKANLREQLHTKSGGAERGPRAATRAPSFYKGI